MDTQECSFCQGKNPQASLGHLSSVQADSHDQIATHAQRASEGQNLTSRFTATVLRAETEHNSLARGASNARARVGSPNTNLVSFL